MPGSRPKKKTIFAEWGNMSIPSFQIVNIITHLSLYVGLKQKICWTEGKPEDIGQGKSITWLNKLLNYAIQKIYFQMQWCIRWLLSLTISTITLISLLMIHSSASAYWLSPFVQVNVKWVGLDSYMSRWSSLLLLWNQDIWLNYLSFPFCESSLMTCWKCLLLQSLESLFPSQESKLE